jgi:type IV pilus assembly protein PilM
MGTDATDLVVTNGYRVWQRSVPLGGNHFTKALTKELKLTFAKAEHLKRNAASAQDPKAVFQAMRPVFNDLLTEIQRSITYFTSINRTANIARVVPLGNAMKLPGLRRYLSQSLGYEAATMDGFRGLAGPEVVKAPAFRENRLSFGTCYGLAIQALGKSSLTTNLLPGEILKDRVIRGKKPWALAAAAVLLLGFAIYFVGFARAMGRMGTDEQGPYKDAEDKVASVVNDSSRLKQEADTYMAEFQAMDEIGKNLLKSVEGRIQWLELLRAVNSCLPTDLAAHRQKLDPDQEQEELEPTADQIMARDRLYISNLEARYTENLERWFAGVSRFYQPAPGEPMPQVTPAAAPGPDAFGAPGVPGDSMPGMTPPGWDDPGAESPAGEASSGGGPSGPGWVIALTGYHYHNPNEPGRLMGAEYVKRKLLDKLRDPSFKVMLPKKDQPDKLEAVSLKDLGIGYAVLLPSGRVKWVPVVNPYAKRAVPGSTGGDEEGYPGYPAAPMSSSMPGVPYGPRGTASAGPEGAVLKLGRFDFLLQFCWQPSTVSEREEKKDQAEPESGTPL